MFPPLSFAAGRLSEDSRAVSRMAYEAHENLRRLYQHLSQFQERDIVDANGNKLTVLGIRPGRVTTIASEWFEVSRETDGDSPTVAVNEGRILAPDVSGLGTDPPTVTGLLKEYTVNGASLEVEDGSVIYLKLTVTHPAASTFTASAETDDYVSVEVIMDVHRFYSIAGEVVALTAAPSPSATESFITLAEISVTNGTVEITQRHKGAVVVPAIIAPVLKSVTATSAIDSANYWTCVDGTPTEVSFLIPE